MSVAAPIMDNYTYNLTKIISDDAISNPGSWLTNFNETMNGIFIGTIFYAIAIVLYVVMRRQEGVDDIEAAVYTGLIMSVVGMILYLVEPFSGVKLLSWEAYVPILIITAGAIGMNFFSRRF